MRPVRGRIETRAIGTVTVLLFPIVTRASTPLVVADTMCLLPGLLVVCTPPSALCTARRFRRPGPGRAVRTSRQVGGCGGPVRRPVVTIIGRRRHTCTDGSSGLGLHPWRPGREAPRLRTDGAGARGLCLHFTHPTTTAPRPLPQPRGVERFARGPAVMSSNDMEQTVTSGRQPGSVGAPAGYAEFERMLPKPPPAPPGLPYAAIHPGGGQPGPAMDMRSLHPSVTVTHVTTRRPPVPHLLDTELPPWLVMRDRARAPPGTRFILAIA